MVQSGLYARLCHTFLVVIVLPVFCSYATASISNVL